jgi:NAD(P)-dependent dehydrogenase (short-subunit alcohol dehydrogenase family)
MGQLEGKNVFLTGASRGIGREIARGLAKEGASIALVARTEPALKELATEVDGLGGRGVAIPADVSDREQVKDAVRRTHDALGDIHVLINSAGVLDNEPIAGHSDEAWEYHYGVNVNSYFFTIREIIGEMFERGAGRVVNIASTSSKVPIGPNRAAYVSSKHAVLGLTKEVAFEAAPHGVTVNAICPGFVLTEMVEDSMRKFARDSGKTPEETREFWTAKIPMGRFIDPVEIVPLVLFLLSDGAGAITMQAINVDGGFSPN